MIHNESCPECTDHERSLARVNRNTLSVDDLGPVGYSPLFNLNPAGLAYFLPRLIEFATENVNDCDGEPFVVRFISLVMAGPEHPRFELLGHPQQELVLKSLRHIRKNYRDTVESAGWSDELDQAVRNWGGQSA